MSNPQYVDYERDCKKCGKCCSPQFWVNTDYTRFKRLKCKYLDSANLCTIYHERKKRVGCFSPHEYPSYFYPDGCAFGGAIQEIEDGEDLILLNPPEYFIGILLTGLFEWR